jgi:hypothetical protein
MSAGARGEVRFECPAIALAWPLRVFLGRAYSGYAPPSLTIFDAADLGRSTCKLNY